MGSEITHLANQHGDSSQEKWKVENSCQLHQPHKACSKDSYPLPRINQLIDSISGHEVFISLMCTMGTTKSLCTPMTWKNNLYYYTWNILL